jgi:hypothetical protein
MITHFHAATWGLHNQLPPHVKSHGPRPDNGSRCFDERNPVRGAGRSVHAALADAFDAEAAWLAFE